MAKQTEQTKKETTKKEKLDKTMYYYAVGRRREASARVRLYILANESEVTVGDKKYTKGQVIVNGRPAEEYFPLAKSQKLYMEPFRTTNTLDRFVTTIKVSGGGLFGQLDAVIHGISRALVKIDDEKFRPILKKRGFMTRDPRTRERRKAGLAQKARKKKQSPKR